MRVNHKNKGYNLDLEAAVSVTSVQGISGKNFSIPWPKRFYRFLIWNSIEDPNQPLCSFPPGRQKIFRQLLSCFEQKCPVDFCYHLATDFNQNSPIYHGNQKQILKISFHIDCIWAWLLQFALCYLKLVPLVLFREMEVIILSMKIRR